MKKIVLLFFTLFCLSNFCFADWFGISNIPEETPFGNSINFKEKCLFMRNGVHVNHVNELYFYNDCVIGTTSFIDQYSSVNKYFVANEMFNTVDTFNNEIDWKAFIKLHNLEPLIWKRTHTKRWSVITGLNGFYVLFLILAFGLPIFIGYKIINIAIKIKVNNFHKPLKIISIITFSLLVIRYLLDVFPGSI
jgi:hypothetical protein